MRSAFETFFADQEICKLLDPGGGKQRSIAAGARVKQLYGMQVMATPVDNVVAVKLQYSLPIINAENSKVAKLIQDTPHYSLRINGVDKYQSLVANQTPSLQQRKAFEAEANQFIQHLKLILASRNYAPRIENIDQLESLIRVWGKDMKMQDLSAQVEKLVIQYKEKLAIKPTIDIEDMDYLRKLYVGIQERMNKITEAIANILSSGWNSV